MRQKHWKLVLAAAAVFAVATPAAASADDARTDARSTDDAPAAWQGQGQGQGQGRGNANAERPRGNQGQGNDNAERARGNQGQGNANAERAQGNQGRGNDAAARGQGNSGRGNAAVDRDRPGNRGNAAARGRGHSRARPDVARVRASIDRLPEPVRRFVTSNRRGERIAGSALAIASLRGIEPARIRIDDGDGWTIVKNDRDDVLFRIDDDEELGAWRMRRLGDERPNDQSPAFCRSGAGHPVWGREWCIDKGFGLGVNQRSIWSRADDDLDVVFRRRPDANVLDREGLIGVLGDIVFGRLAVQSLLLGNDEPLAGRWVASSDERDAPFVLRVTAGDVAIAEFVDDDRDDDVDVLFVAQPRW